VIIARRSASGVPHFLMQERAAGMSFAGGAMVFPGGAVDEADGAYARALAVADDIDEMAARIAAVRETIEECGLVLTARTGAVDATTSAALRAALRSGTMLAEVADAHGISFDFMRLIPFARWCPSAQALHKRFDTRFFVAALEEGEQVDDLLPDGSESVRLAWHSAHEVLEEANAERGQDHLSNPAQSRAAGPVSQHRGTGGTCASPPRQPDFPVDRAARRRAASLHPGGAGLSGDVRAPEHRNARVKRAHNIVVMIAAFR
jgi:8-oxo-dGTP pyrophosphatase MutT (NUDIX family)